MSEQDFYVVGMGSSAGGLDALQKFVQNIASKDDNAYVIIQHLKSDYPSALTDILARETNIPVIEIQNNIKVEPGNIYVMPAGYKLRLVKGRFKLDLRPETEIINRAINYFFISLAAEKQSKCFGVILSGTGTDGVEGVKEIERLSGIVIVQDPASATFDGMPENTIHLDHPDYITYPEKMPALIQEIKSRKAA